MNTAPAVTVVIPARNAARQITDVIRAVDAQGGLPFDPAIIVVDDGSTDETASLARDAGATVISQQNRGPAAARNRGWRTHDAGKYVWFLDSDCFPEPQALALLLRAIDVPEIAAAGGTYTNARRNSMLARVVNAEIAMRHARMGPDVKFLGSYHLLVRRSVLESTGGFDESYRAASGEDNDLSYRMRRDGHRLRFAASSRVAHLHPTNPFVYWKEQSRHGEWRMKLYRDHPTEMRGDDYSGPFDFLEPPLALLLTIAILAALFTRDRFPLAILAPALILAALIALALPTGARIGRREGGAAFLFYLALRPARAVARGFGMARGIIRFWTPGRAGTMSESGRLHGNRILVIIPAFHEEETIGEVVRDVYVHVPAATVVVVNDGSLDRTEETAAAAGAIVLSLPFNLGIGAAMQTGYRFADEEGFDIAIQVDGDGQHLPSEIPILLAEIDRGTDLAIGARFLGRGEYDPPPLRRLGILFFSFAVSALVGRRFHDTTSGFRAANRRVIESFSRYYPYDYPEPEAILILSRAGFAVREVPARIQEREGGRSSITLRKSVYYLLKVFLALAVGRFRTPPH